MSSCISQMKPKSSFVIDVDGLYFAHLYEDELILGQLLQL